MEHVKTSEISRIMQQDALNAANIAFRECQLEKHIARYIQEKFASKYGGNWHCIVGGNFGTSITYDANHYIHFTHSMHAILLFRSGL
jgi:dynein light chain LC8-type